MTIMKLLYYVAKTEEVKNWEEEGKKYIKKHQSLLIDRFDSLSDDENDKENNNDEKRWEKRLEKLQEKREEKDRSKIMVD